VRPKPGRLILYALAAGAVYFAIQGGEYGTSDLVKQRLEKRRLTATIDSLEREVDSLRKYRKAVETDPRTQERIAREQWGMVRAGEILYLFDTLPDTGDGAS
jgi:cell division protein FtsB